MYRPAIILLILFTNIFPDIAQMPGFKNNSKDLLPLDSGKLNFSVTGNSFFKNNEYFNPIESGYTLIGFRVAPTLNYQLSSNFKIEAGADILKYSGQYGIYSFEPVFRVQYQPSEKFQMILGSLFGAQNHNLIEPLYRWELNFTAPVENGVQFLYSTQKFHADVWLNWEKFIMHGDPFQEELTVGISGEYNLLGENASTSISIPFQTLFKHRGGQINSIDTSLVTLSNWATGIKFNKKFNHRIFQYWNTEIYYLGFSDFSPQKLQQFKNGYALYPKSKIGIGQFSAEIGYFWGTRFISPMGERLYHSGTIPASEIVYTGKKLLTGKLWYEKEISSGVIMGAYFESYTDFNISKSDYSYGVHILFNHDFFLLKR